MKCGIILLMLLSVSTPGFAQDPGVPPEGQPPPADFAADELDADAAPVPPPPPLPPEFSPHSPALKWMERLRRDNPAEFHRLQDLKEHDPVAFRRELHRLLIGERANVKLRNYPRIMQAVHDMPAEERQAFMEQLCAPPEDEWGPPKGKSRRWNGPFPPGPSGFHSPEVREAEAELRDLQEQLGVLSEKYRAEPDAAARTKLAEQLRTALIRIFDLRDMARARHIEYIERDLARLKKSLDDRRARRDGIIERRLQELTTGPGNPED